MARQTDVVLLLLLAMAATAFEAKHHHEHHKCPLGWIKYEGRCFTYQAISMDWASAEQHCNSLGANLVSVHSENEYQEVKRLIRAHNPEENPVWLGLSNCQKRNYWFWSDGFKMTFTKWSPAEPNFVDNECCVLLFWGGKPDWLDAPCEWKNHFVCARSLTQKG